MHIYLSSYINTKLYLYVALHNSKTCNVSVIMSKGEDNSHIASQLGGGYNYLTLDQQSLRNRVSTTIFNYFHNNRVNRNARIYFLFTS